MFAFAFAITAVVRCILNRSVEKYMAIVNGKVFGKTLFTRYAMQQTVDTPLSRATHQI